PSESVVPARASTALAALRLLAIAVLLLVVAPCPRVRRIPQTLPIRTIQATSRPRPCNSEWLHQPDLVWRFAMVPGIAAAKLALRATDVVAPPSVPFGNSSLLRCRQAGHRHRQHCKRRHRQDARDDMACILPEAQGIPARHREPRLRRLGWQVPVAGFGRLRCKSRRRRTAS